MRTNIITDSKALHKAIESIAKRGARLDADIQTAGLSCIDQAARHGNTMPMDRLYNALPNGSRRLALVEWLLNYAPVKVLDKREDKDAISAGRVFKLDREKKADIEGADETPWYEFKKEREAVDAFDVLASVESFVKKWEAAMKKGITVEHKAEAIARLKEIISAQS